MGHWVLHVDLDQFIAAVELLRRPELRGLPVIVGGDGDPSKRGVVSTASYRAREYGVHSGMPLRLAARKCPEAVFLPVDAPVYLAASARVMDTLRSFDAIVEVMGWDEAFMGVTADDPFAVAREIQARVRYATELDCSVGIGDNKLQAKLATDFGKPAGVYQITSATWFPLLGGRGTDALWGIGAKTAKKLAALGIHTVSELARADPGSLAAKFGPATGPWLIHLANGRGDSRVTDEPYVARSHSRETTFQTDLTDWDVVRREVGILAARVAEDVTAENRAVARVVVKVRYKPFLTRTHGHALATPGTDPAALAEAAFAALEKFTRDRPVRLLGVRAEFA